MSETKVRVRFAPSPTGPLHIGGVRTALYNYLFAKKHNGTFILRIEDTDQARYVNGAEDYIFDALNWCGLTPDESLKNPGKFGPYKQSERKEIYRPYAEELVKNGHAYYAFDSSEELSKVRDQTPNWKYDFNTRNQMKNSLTLSAEEVEKKIASGDPYVVRFKMQEDEDIRFDDIIRGSVIINTNDLDDKVLFKSDGIPTYHLANIVDDHLMEISHVIRGEEWLPSAPLHVLLYRSFGWTPPLFAHLPLLLKPDGPGKLSKRDGDRLGFPVFPTEWKNENGEVSSGYREEGYFPDAFINMLAFLGWSPGTEQEIFSKEELINTFSLERVGKAGAKFDPDKAHWFNQQYLRSQNNDILAEQAMHLVIEEEADKAFLTKVCGLMKERITFIKDIISDGDYFFHAPTVYDKKTTRKKWKDHTALIIEEFAGEINNTDFLADKLEETFNNFLQKKEIGVGQVLPNLRLLITGKSGGPSMFEVMELLGKEEVLNRIEKGIIAIQELKTTEA